MKRQGLEVLFWKKVHFIYPEIGSYQEMKICACRSLNIFSMLFTAGSHLMYRVEFHRLNDKIKKRYILLLFKQH